MGLVLANSNVTTTNVNTLEIETLVKGELSLKVNKKTINTEDDGPGCWAVGKGVEKVARKKYKFSKEIAEIAGVIAESVCEFFIDF